MIYILLHCYSMHAPSLVKSVLMLILLCFVVSIDSHQLCARCDSLFHCISSSIFFPISLSNTDYSCCCDMQKSGRAPAADGQQGERPPECKQQQLFLSPKNSGLGVALACFRSYIFIQFQWSSSIYFLYLLLFITWEFFSFSVSCSRGSDLVLDMMSLDFDATC